METDFTITDQGGVRFLEGRPGVRLLNRTDDAGLVVEACLSSRAKSALLYAENLTEGFFDLSSGNAGAILQKLRNYRIRLVVVCPPNSVRFSRMFEEMVAEESRSGYFRVFDSVEAARDWVTLDSP